MAVSLSKVLVLLLAVAAIGCYFKGDYFASLVTNPFALQETAPFQAVTTPPDVVRPAEQLELERLELLEQIKVDPVSFIPPVPSDLKRTPAIYPVNTVSEAAWDDVTAEIERLNNIKWDQA